MSPRFSNFFPLGKKHLILATNREYSDYYCKNCKGLILIKRWKYRSYIFSLIESPPEMPFHVRSIDRLPPSYHKWLLSRPEIRDMLKHEQKEVEQRCQKIYSLMGKKFQEIYFPTI